MIRAAAFCPHPSLAVPAGLAARRRAVELGHDAAPYGANNVVATWRARP